MKWSENTLKLRRRNWPELLRSEQRLARSCQRTLQDLVAKVEGLTQITWSSWSKKRNKVCQTFFSQLTSRLFSNCNTSKPCQALWWSTKSALWPTGKSAWYTLQSWLPIRMVWRKKNGRTSSSTPVCWQANCLTSPSKSSQSAASCDLSASRWRSTKSFKWSIQAKKNPACILSSSTRKKPCHS